MIDGFGRTIDYLRISVTDKCNLRCKYCMPEGGIELIPHEELLSLEELYRVVRIMEGLGIKKVRFTGGEPLVRKNLIKLIEDVGQLSGIEEIAMTTNGVLFADRAAELKKAGLTGVNISLDTLDRELFREITRRDALEKVLEGIDAVLQYPDIPLKINCVPMGKEEQDLVKLAGLAKDKMLHVRFIEMMPIGTGKDYCFLSEGDIRRQLEAVYGPMKPYKKVLGNGPCQYYELEGFQGKIGFISAISHKFCDECNRIRLTSQGFLKTCLQYNKGKDLRTLMREGASDEVIKAAIMEAIEAKPRAHQFHDAQIVEENSMGMSQIGG